MSLEHSLALAPTTPSSHQLSAMSPEQGRRWEEWQHTTATASHRSGMQAQVVATAMLASSFAYVAFQLMSVTR